MALRDYVICGECETKIIYDGYDNGRDRLEEVWGDPNADVWTVHLLCPDCIKKLQADLATARAKIDSLRHHVKALQLLVKMQHAPQDMKLFAAEVDAIDAALAGKDAP